jgi:hypothetical protein
MKSAFYGDVDQSFEQDCTYSNLNITGLPVRHFRSGLSAGG